MMWVSVVSGLVKYISKLAGNENHVRAPIKGFWLK